MKSMYLINVYLSIFCSLMCISTTITAQTFYKWKDKNGSVHYTELPPPAQAKHLGKIDTYGSYLKPTQNQPINIATKTITPPDTNTEPLTNNSTSNSISQQQQTDSNLIKAPQNSQK